MISALGIESRGFQVHVVEDDPVLRAVLCEFLELAGYRVTQSAGGGHAEEFLLSHAGVDLIVSDLEMPGLSGRELVTRLRSIISGRNGKTRILVLSSAASEECLAYGADAWLRKPVAPRVLLLRLDELLGPNTSRSEVE